MSRLAGVLSAAVLVAAIGLVLLPFSAAGTRLLLSLLPSAAPVQVSYAGGSLGGELQLEMLRVSLDGLEVELSGVRSRLRPACLWQSLVCFAALEIEQLEVRVLPGESAADDTEAQTAEAGSIEMLALPLRLRAPGVRIGRAEVRWPGGMWRQGASELDIELKPEGVFLGNVVLRDAQLALEAAESSAPSPLVLPSLALPLTLAIDDFLLQRPSVRQGERLEAFDAIRGALRWRGERLEIASLQVSQQSRGRLQASGQVAMSGDWPLQLGIRADLDMPSLPMALGARRVELALSGSTRALQLELLSPGEPQVQLTGDVDLLAPALPFNASLRLNGDQPLPLAGLPGLTGLPPGLVDAAILWPLQATAQGDLDEQDLTLTARVQDLAYAMLSLELSARHAPGLVQVHSFLLDAAEAGSLSVEGRLNYADTIAWEAAVHSGGLQMPELSEYLFGQVAGSLTTRGRLGDDDWQVELQEVDLVGDVNGLPAMIKGGLQLDSSELIRSGALRAQVNGAEIDVSAGASGAAGARAELGIADLGRWSRGAGGSVLLNVDWDRADNRLALRGSVEGIHWNSLRADRGVLEGAVSLADGPRGAGRLRLDQLELAGVNLDGLSLTVQADRETATLELSSEGEIAGALKAAATASERVWEVALQRTEFATPIGPLTLAAPVQARFAGDSGTLGAHCWQLPETELCFSESRFGATGAVIGRLTGDLALFAALLPQQLEVRGPLNADIALSWGDDSPLRAQAQLSSPGGSVTQFYPEGESATFTWDVLQATLQQDDRGLALQAGLLQDDRQRLALTVQLPPDRAGKLQGELAIDALQMGALQPFLPQLERLEGTLNGQVTLSGSVQEPLADGVVRWTDGVVRLEVNPTELDAVDVQIALQGSRAALRGVALLGGGQLELTGDAQLGEEPALRLNIKGGNNRLLYPPSTQVEVSPDLQLALTPAGIQARGEVLVHEGLLAYEELPPGSVTLSDDVIEVDFTGAPLEAHNPLRLDADLRLRIKDRFRIRGKDLNITVGGDLSLRQAPERPLQLFGSLNILGGELRAYGQRLLVRQGRIAFSGVPENPELNLRAEREIPAEDVRAGVTVTGTLEQPELTVYAEPTMSQTEALSYLLRGRGLDSGAGADGTAMALSLGTSLMNRSALVEELNKVPGLRNVEFGTDGSEDDTAATVSGYIGERIYLSYGVGLYEPINVLTARLYLQARLWLEVVSRLESSVDLYYSFDIN